MAHAGEVAVAMEKTITSALEEQYGAITDLNEATDRLLAHLGIPGRGNLPDTGDRAEERQEIIPRLIDRIETYTRELRVTFELLNGAKEQLHRL